MTTVFTYSTTSDTLNAAVVVDKLKREIQAAAITIALDSISTSGDVITITFKDDLPAGQDTALTLILGAHDGNPGVDDPQKIQFVGADLTPASVVDVAGVKRLALSLDGVLTGPQGPQGDTGPQGIQGAAGPTATFGSEYHFEESTSESFTTSGSYSTKLLLTTGDLPAGDYRITWSCELYTSDIDMNCRIRLNDSEDLMEIEHTSADRGNKHYWSPHSGFTKRALSGVNTVTLDWNDDGGGTAYIRRARLELHRI